MSRIELAQHGDGRLDDATLQAIYRLRHAVFHDRLGWDVTSDHGMEHDEFDQANPIYALARGAHDEIEGCTRMLPTTGPYMLKDVFPELLAGRPAPQQRDVWEISRFALAEGKSDSSGCGMGSIPMGMVAAAARFARANGICRYVFATTVFLERMLRHCGLHIERLGPSMRIGSVMSVACTLEIDAITEYALFGTLPEHAQRKAA
jgi:acyl homoserine lactone synthase